MTKTLTALFALLTVGALVPPPAQAAAAPSDRCVTHAEYLRINDGMTMSEVAALVDARPITSHRDGTTVIKGYPTCIDHGREINVTYVDWMVTAKGYARAEATDTYRCASLSEFRHVETGMSVKRVHALLDVPGYLKQSDPAHNLSVRRYHTCATDRHQAAITFQKHHVTAKTWNAHQH